jgi:DNA topoisomerase-1
VQSAAGKDLVIVESPAKARTLSNFLGSDYVVEASIGHVRDLPKSKLGVDVDEGFQPTYVIPTDKKQIVTRIKKTAQGAKNIWLATDPDREGEAISWHLVQAADLGDIPHQRLVFHEITRDAVRHAFDEPRPINQELVDAQQARRVLDRLIGYKISPILGQKVRRGLSAGRVQSPALKMVVDREREIQAFVPQEYWTIDLDLKTLGAADDQAFRAKFEGIAGDKIEKLELGSETAVNELLTRLRESRFRVSDIRKRTQARRPAAPYTTSTLQQDASRKLGYTTRRTMSLAQQLYEGVNTNDGSVGLITYMRTDSTTISEQARDEVRHYIGGRFGTDFVPPSARYFGKKSKYAQEAHEAIRPTSVRRDPESMRAFLDNDQYRLYRLIWNRFVAGQMADAQYDVTTVDIDALPQSGEPNYALRANARRLRFAGWLELYGGQPDDDDEENTAAAILPDLVHGQALSLVQLFPDQHFTEPPPRYTEASLVKALEENGLGRPSTYASIMSTIQDREYVERVDRALRPTELGFIVNDLLQEHFADLLSVPFTAQMEEELDEIASGERQWSPVVKEFYDPLESALDKAKEADVVTEETDEICEKSGHPMIVRWGRFGKFLACSGYPECKNTRPLEEEPQLENEEFCQECGAPMTLKRGRYGTFLACTRYPECKGTRPFLKKVEGVKCPKDAGDIVEKSTRKGRQKVFYGCANYPECDWTSWSRPLPEPCPDCGGLVVASGQKTAKCTNCAWKGPFSELEASVPADSAPVETKDSDAAGEPAIAGNGAIFLWTESDGTLPVKRLSELPSYELSTEAFGRVMEAVATWSLSAPVEAIRVYRETDPESRDWTETVVELAVDADSATAIELWKDVTSEVARVKRELEPVEQSHVDKHFGVHLVWKRGDGTGQEDGPSSEAQTLAALTSER